MTASRTTLSAPVVAALDAARAIAACYVVAHHVADARGWLHGVGLALKFGQEAVIVFFLLSGFVIHANEHERARHPRGYYWRRLRRIYPPLVVALLVSTLVALADGTLRARFDPAALVGTLASVQDIAALKPGVIVDPYLDNFPLWSLSYEVAFYLAYPPILVALERWPRRTVHLVGAGCCLAYILYALHPGHAALVSAYFAIWWSGAMAARAYAAGKRTLWGLGASIGWLAALAATMGVVVVMVGYRGTGFYPILPLRHVLFALILLAGLFGPLGHLLARIAAPFAYPFAAIASISYALYVLHYPLLVQWSVARTLAGLAVAMLVLIAVSLLVERILPTLLPRAPRD